MGASTSLCRFIPCPPTSERMTVMLKPFLLGGIIVMPRKQLVFGVGRTDSEHRITMTKTVGGKRYQWRCHFYQTWTNMLMRCYSPKYIAKFPTYSECTVSAEWHSFSTFRAWMSCQDFAGKQLDKDLLISGNKIYSEDACIFVDPALNSFLCDHRGARGEWPIGVYWNKRDRKFISRCCNPFTGKDEGLGYFSSADNAYAAWLSRKHEHALAYAEIQTDQRLAAALRIRYLPENLHKIGI